MRVFLGGFSIDSTIAATICSSVTKPSRIADARVEGNASRIEYAGLRKSGQRCPGPITYHGRRIVALDAHHDRAVRCILAPMIPALLLAIQASVQPAASVQTARTVVDAPAGARQPQVAISGGRFKSVFLVFGTKDTVHIALSASEGRTFGRPLVVDEVGNLSLGLRRGPRIVSLRKVVVVTAIAGVKGGGQDGDLWCWRSETNGKSWTKSGPVNPKAGAAREGLHAMAGGPGWKVYTAWIDLETDSPRVLGSLSTDAGSTWAKPVVLEGDASAICPCCAPSAAFGADGSVAVMWRGQSGGARDLVVARSEDGGTTFSKPVKVGTGTWKITSCPMDGGALAAKGNEITAVWRREDKVYASPLSGAEVFLGEGEQPSAAATLAGTYVLWVKKRGGPLMLKGPGSAEPVELDAAASDPVVATAPDDSGFTLATWESGDPAQPKIVVARIDGSTAPR